MGDDFRTASARCGNAVAGVVASSNELSFRLMRTSRSIKYLSSCSIVASSVIGIDGEITSATALAITEGASGAIEAPSRSERCAIARAAAAAYATKSRALSIAAEGSCALLPTGMRRCAETNSPT